MVSLRRCRKSIGYSSSGALFGLAPLQLTSRVASSYASGFTFPHDIHSTRASMLNQIKVYLAGGLAEELMSTLVAETRQLLNTHEALLRDLSLQLLSAGKLAGEIVAATAGKHGLNIAVMAEGHLHIAPYNAELTA